MNLHKIQPPPHHDWSVVRPSDKIIIDRLVTEGTWVRLECGCMNTSPNRHNDITCPAAWDGNTYGGDDYKAECQHPGVCTQHD